MLALRLMMNNSQAYTQAATAHVDLAALQFNLAKVRELAPSSQIMAVVKANSYGHGLHAVSKAVSVEADAFGVARIEEALQLRANGIVKPILLLEGFYSAQDLPVITTNRIQTVVHCIEQLEALEQVQLDSPISVWLKVDTGMHRLGIRPEQFAEFVTRLKRCPNVADDLRFISHFACADERNNDSAPRQLALFKQLTKQEIGECSIAASAGLLALPDSHLDWVRPGIIMYGVSPFADKTAGQMGLKPVMTLTSRLIAIRDVKQGEPIGYGGTWASPCDTKIGIVAIGYGDGYPRTAPNGTPVLVNGRQLPLVGRVCMDMLSVDLGPEAKDCVGDEVILWGASLPVETVAHHIGTSGYELVTKLTSRIAMVY